MDTNSLPRHLNNVSDFYTWSFCFVYTYIEFTLILSLFYKHRSSYFSTKKLTWSERVRLILRSFLILESSLIKYCCKIFEFIFSSRFDIDLKETTFHIKQCNVNACWGPAAKWSCTRKDLSVQTSTSGRISCGKVKFGSKICKRTVSWIPGKHNWR